ncbi:MAG: Hsp20/alpha crystallin family protein [Candidatus Tectomicrobia bacterium]|nr:Hsp20/alpha crystallin family protein [Candidatus Tectomicrobia bacterium]
MATTWNPMEALRRDIDRAFNHASFANEPSFRTAFLPGRAARRYPLINLSEDHDHVYIEALAPGVDPATIDLAVIRNVLTISGEKRRHPEDIKPEAFHRSERAAGKFVRTIELPVEVDAAQVKAEYKHGILMVTLPKAAAAKPKQISVSVG